MKLDTRLRAGEVITDRELFLLGVVRYLDGLDPWYLDEAPEMTGTLKEDFRFNRDGDEGAT